MAGGGLEGEWAWSEAGQAELGAEMSHQCGRSDAPPRPAGDRLLGASPFAAGLAGCHPAEGALRACDLQCTRPGPTRGPVWSKMAR